MFEQLVDIICNYVEIEQEDIKPESRFMEDLGFTSFDFIADEVSFEDKYHIVIGNPPYVEDFKSGLELSDKYGNI